MFASQYTGAFHRKVARRWCYQRSTVESVHSLSWHLACASVWSVRRRKVDAVSCVFIRQNFRVIPLFSRPHVVKKTFAVRLQTSRQHILLALRRQLLPRRFSVFRWHGNCDCVPDVRWFLSTASSDNAAGLAFPAEPSPEDLQQRGFTFVRWWVWQPKLRQKLLIYSICYFHFGVLTHQSSPWRRGQFPVARCCSCRPGRRILFKKTHRALLSLIACNARVYLTTVGAFVWGAWGERSCPRSATVIHSLALGLNTQPFSWEGDTVPLSWCFRWTHSLGLPRSSSENHKRERRWEKLRRIW